MAGFYERAAATADRMIAKYGQAAMLRPPGVSTDAQDVPVTVVVSKFDLREVDGQRVRASDLKVLLAREGLTQDPTTGHRLILEGRAIPIIGIQPLAPGGTRVMWTLQCR